MVQFQKRNQTPMGFKGHSIIFKVLVKGKLFKNKFQLEAANIQHAIGIKI